MTAQRRGRDVRDRRRVVVTLDLRGDAAGHRTQPFSARGRQDHGCLPRQCVHGRAARCELGDRRRGGRAIIRAAAHARQEPDRAVGDLHALGEGRQQHRVRAELDEGVEAVSDEVRDGGGEAHTFA